MGFAAGIFIVLALIVKMVGLEPYRIVIFPFEITLVAVLLPLAMLFGRYGVVGMTVGCVSAHAVFFNGFAEILATGLAAFVGSYLSYRLAKKWRGPMGLFVGSWIITAAWSIIIGVFLALTGNAGFLQGAGLMFWRLWIPVTIVGFAAALLIKSLPRLTIDPNISENAVVPATH